MSKKLLGGSLLTLALGSVVQSITYLDDSIGEGWDVPSVPYREFISKVKTGDILLSSSTSATSWTTRIYTRSLWSHVGIAFYHQNRLYEWSAHNESENIGNSLNVVCGGPQLVPIENLVAESGTLFWKSISKTEEQERAIAGVVEKLAYKLEFSNTLEFLSYLGWPFSKMFGGYGGGMACPHIVAATYSAVGMMDLDKDISLYTPVDFSDTGDVKWKVPVGLTNMVVGFDATRLVHIPQLFAKK